MQVPKLPLPPPFEEGWVLQDGLPVGRQLYDTLLMMMNVMNAGIDVIKRPGEGESIATAG